MHWMKRKQSSEHQLISIKLFQEEHGDAHNLCASAKRELKREDRREGPQ